MTVLVAEVRREEEMLFAPLFAPAEVEGAAVAGPDFGIDRMRRAAEREQVGIRIPVYPVKGYSITVPIVDPSGR